MRPGVGSPRDAAGWLIPCLRQSQQGTTTLSVRRAAESTRAGLPFGHRSDLADHLSNLDALDGHARGWTFAGLRVGHRHRCYFLALADDDV